MNINIYLLLLVMIVLQGCSYEKVAIRNDIEAKRYNPKSMARVRVFSSPELNASYLPNSSCEQIRGGNRHAESIPLRRYKNEETYILGRKSDLLGMKAEDYQNKVISMPASDATEELKNDRVGYDEVVVPAEKPSVFTIFYSVNDQHVRAQCFPPPISLSPKAGRDYEVRLVFEKTAVLASQCRLSVRELSGMGVIQSAYEIKADMCVQRGGAYVTIRP